MAHGLPADLILVIAHQLDAESVLALSMVDKTFYEATVLCDSLWHTKSKEYIAVLPTERVPKAEVAKLIRISKNIRNRQFSTHLVSSWTSFSFWVHKSYIYNNIADGYDVHGNKKPRVFQEQTMMRTCLSCTTTCAGLVQKKRSDTNLDILRADGSSFQYPLTVFENVFMIGDYFIKLPTSGGSSIKFYEISSGKCILESSYSPPRGDITNFVALFLEGAVHIKNNSWTLVPWEDLSSINWKKTAIQYSLDLSKDHVFASQSHGYIQLRIQDSGYFSFRRLRKNGSFGLWIRCELKFGATQVSTLTTFEEQAPGIATASYVVAGVTYGVIFVLDRLVKNKSDAAIVVGVNQGAVINSSVIYGIEFLERPVLKDFSFERCQIQVDSYFPSLIVLNTSQRSGPLFVVNFDN
eukprot:TRINITY_DN4637_c0_g1_i1.p1 TRINITY_DN4637_c0_g1~~TRINITY_DN4637_c0_g1_i1.p1  ORF type:complete len:409 (-),score=39.46 TRINITY_DN4637_c0_g1_i1:8-1234(-)